MRDSEVIFLISKIWSKVTKIINIEIFLIN